MKRLQHTSNISAAVLRLVAAFGLLAAFLPTHTPAQAAPASPETPQAAAWYDGMIQYSTITNCVSIIQGSPYTEPGAGTYVGFLADPENGQPAPGQVYYLHVVVGGLGNACSGMRAYIDIGLPANTSLAISTSNPVYCFYDGVQVTGGCPQSLPPSSYNPGMLMLPATTEVSTGYTWPIPIGKILDIRIPVVTSTAISNSTMQAKVWMLDGNSSPWLNPQQGVYVFSSTPTIIYPSPSTINITATGAKSQVYLYSFGLGGSGYFDLGTTTSYEIIHDLITIQPGGTAWLAWDEWGPPSLTPDTLYHWRFTFTDSNGTTYLGADQTFRTLPDGQVTVGTGSAASCTQAALTSVLGTAKTIKFDCGTLPVTITLTSAQSIVSNVKLDGDNKVVLDAQGTHNHFNVQAGWNLTLEEITLFNGNNAVCGGAVYVPTGAQATLTRVRFLDNNTSSSGGALCVDSGGTATMLYSVFSGNHASLHGGAIRSYGSVSVNDSVFTANTAGINGGAIDNTGSLYIGNSIFTSNTAGVRGGAVNNYLGTVTARFNILRQNASSGYGGAFVNDGGTATATLDSNLFENNTAASVGGGVRNSGTLTASGDTFVGNTANTSGGAFESSATLTLVNETLSANHAVENGGGIFWNGSGQISLLNVTLSGNTAGGQGGSIYAGTTYNGNVSLKNTLLAAGTPTNCGGSILSLGYNLENGSSCGLASAGDHINTHPGLTSLRANGDWPFTHALLPGSAALDGGTNSGCPATDQRGLPRPYDGDYNNIAVCDIGALESSDSFIFLPLLRR